MRPAGYKFILAMNKKKLALVRQLMVVKNIDSILIQRSNNFAWLTDGVASYVGLASDCGASFLLITRESQYVITNNIELKNLEFEEGLTGWSFIVSSWLEDKIISINRNVVGVLGSDYLFLNAIDCSNEFAKLRYNLDSLEIHRYIQLGLDTGRAIQQTAKDIRPGMSEFKISGILSGYCNEFGIVPIVNLIAVDERIYKHGHPLPSSKKLEKHSLLVLGARKWGLVASASRLVYFGKISSELREKTNACARIDAAFIKATKSGFKLSDAFQAGIDCYESEGYKNDWHTHHQGGLTSYLSREIVATSLSTHDVLSGQAYAWNPTLSGVKSEDTILLTGSETKIITQVDDWPLIDCGNIKRPDILEC